MDLEYDGGEHLGLEGGTLDLEEVEGVPTS